MFVNVNDHYQFDADQPEATESVIQVVENQFDVSVKGSNKLIDHIMSL